MNQVGTGAATAAPTMVYTHRHPALLIMGLLLLALAAATQAGSLAGVLQWLGAGKNAGEMVRLAYIFGGIGTVVGLWHLFGKHQPGHLDYYASTIAGAMFILFLAMMIRWFFDPAVATLSKMMGPVLGGKYLHDVMGLNYVVIGILAGMFVVNVVGIPTWAQNGVRVSRLGLKTGVILLGTLYSLAELAQLGKLSVVLVGVFVLGSVWMVLLFGRHKKLPNTMTGVLAAGVGVCGVSAAVASAPVVKARSADIAYTIGTILVWGVGCMFLFPVVGHLLGLGYVQFGAWAGTGILNSAQVAGAALAFQPNGIETLKVAEIFNITRVLFLPIIVIWLAIWFVKHEEGAQTVNIGRVLVEKFPVFVIGFILLFALSSTGIFAPANHYQGAYFDNNISEKKLLTNEQIATLGAEASKVTREDQRGALQRLIENRKVMSTDDDDTLRGVVNAGTLSKDASGVLKKAHSAVRHTAPKIAAFRDWIAWLFAFGLTGLGMQITLAALKQAGGQPLVIGGVVGTVKAIGSLIVVLMFVRETI